MDVVPRSPNRRVILFFLPMRAFAMSSELPAAGAIGSSHRWRRRDKAHSWNQILSQCLREQGIALEPTRRLTVRRLRRNASLHPAPTLHDSARYFLFLSYPGAMVRLPFRGPFLSGFGCASKPDPEERCGE